jgi:hypothetical protein
MMECGGLEKEWIRVSRKILMDLGQVNRIIILDKFEWRLKAKEKILSRVTTKARSR